MHNEEMKQRAIAKSVPLDNYKALSIRLFRFIRLETYCSLDDKIQNSGQNRKTFDKNVLRHLDKRYLEERTLLSKMAQECQEVRH
jgi:uncharacterized protein YdcH (DUF465 family)